MLKFFFLFGKRLEINFTNKILNNFKKNFPMVMKFH